MKILAVLCVVIIICILLQFDPVAKFVAEKTGKTVDFVKSTARTVLVVALGGALVSWGVAALSVPFVGIAMIAIGLALVAYALWPMFQTKPQDAAYQGQNNIFK